MIKRPDKKPIERTNADKFYIRIEHHGRTLWLSYGVSQAGFLTLLAMPGIIFAEAFTMGDDANKAGYLAQITWNVKPTLIPCDNNLMPAPHRETLRKWKIFT